MAISEPNRLESRLQRLELVALDSMKASVADYFRRVPLGPKSRPRWTAEMYPTGIEKELYGQFGHILLSAHGVMVPALLRVLDAPASQLPEYSHLAGTWRAYRISTV
jgi:hypothetical protein